jgi:hypothetical protein
MKPVALVHPGEARVVELRVVGTTLTPARCRSRRWEHDGGLAALPLLAALED